MTWTPTAADKPIWWNKLRSSEDWWRGCRGDVLRQTVPGITSGSDWKCAVSDGEKARAMDRGQRHARMPPSTDGQSVSGDDTAADRRRWRAFISIRQQSQSLKAHTLKQSQSCSVHVFNITTPHRRAKHKMRCSVVTDDWCSRGLCVPIGHKRGTYKI